MIKFFNFLTRMMTIEQQREFNGSCIDRAFEILDRNRQGEGDWYSKDKKLRELIYDKAEYLSTHCFTSIGSDVDPTGSDIYDELCEEVVRSENKLALKELNQIERARFGRKWDRLCDEYDFKEVAEFISDYYELI